jgi:hypothetical protein
MDMTSYQIPLSPTMVMDEKVIGMILVTVLRRVLEIHLGTVCLNSHN